MNSPEWSPPLGRHQAVCVGWGSSERGAGPGVSPDQAPGITAGRERVAQVSHVTAETDKILQGTQNTHYQGTEGLWICCSIIDIGYHGNRRFGLTSGHSRRRRFHRSIQMSPLSRLRSQSRVWARDWWSSRPCLRRWRSPRLSRSRGCGWWPAASLRRPS